MRDLISESKLKSNPEKKEDAPKKFNRYEDSEKYPEFRDKSTFTT